MSVISYTVYIERSCCDCVQCTLGTRQTDRADMQFKIVFLAVSTPSELYTYTLPRNELFHSDCLSELRFECKVSTVYVSKQRSLINHVKIIV